MQKWLTWANMLCSIYVCSEMKCPSVGKLSAHSSVMTSSRCLKHQCSPLIFFHLISKQMGRHLKGFKRFCLGLCIKCSLVMDWYLHLKATETLFKSRWKSEADFQLTDRCLTGRVRGLHATTWPVRRSHRHVETVSVPKTWLTFV